MNKRIAIALGLFVALVLLVCCGVRPYPREKVAIWAEQDSWIISGHDIVWYSDADMATEKVRVEGLQGVITTTHLVVTNGLTVTNLVSSSNGLESTNGLVITGNITMSHGAILNDHGAVTVTDELYVTSQGTLMNGLALTGNFTGTGAGSFSSQLTASNGVAATGNITVGTDLDVAGNIFSTSGSVRVNDPALVTGTLGVSSQINAANGIAATGRVTVSGYLSITTWSELYGLVLGLGSTQAVTASYGITPGASSILYVTDDGAQATGTVTLDGTEAITDGGKVGQLLIIMSRETHGATLTIPDGANTQTPAAASIVLGQYDSAMFLWDGTDWVCIGVTNN